MILTDEELLGASLKEIVESLLGADLGLLGCLLLLVGRDGRCNLLSDGLLGHFSCLSFLMC